MGSRTIFDLAMLAFPRDFRRRYGREILRDAGEQLDAEPNTFVLLRLAFDMLRGGVRMRADLLWRDIAFAVRSFVKTPLYTLVAVSTIALGIGLNIAVESVLENVLFRPLPYPNASRLVTVEPEIEVSGFGLTSFPAIAYPDMEALQRGTRTLESVTLSKSDSATLSGNGTGRPRKLSGRVIDERYFGLLGVRPEIGRIFARADLGTHRVVISDHIWRSVFNGDPAAIGKLARLDGVAQTIVGVAPAGFEDPQIGGLVQSDYWRPVDTRDPDLHNLGNYTAFALVRKGAAIAAATADAARVLDPRLRKALHASSLITYRGVSLRPMLASIVSDVRAVLWMLDAAVLFVLLVACVNVANLQLVRAATRARELVVRSALGAGAGRIVAQLSTETAVLAAAGGLFGLAVAWVALHVFTSVGASALPRWSSVGLDVGALVYAVLLVGVTTLAAGIVPALLRRRDLADALRAAGHASERRGLKRLRSALVVVEIALAMILTIAAGLVFRSFLTMTHTDVGFDVRDAYLIHSPSGFASTGTPQARLALFERVVSKLRAIPGVERAAAAQSAPFTELTYTQYVAPGSPARKIQVETSTVSPEFFAALRIPIERGRAFTARDAASGDRVAIVSTSFARQYFGTLDAVGRGIDTGTDPKTHHHQLLTVVGVVGDTRDIYEFETGSHVYQLIAQPPAADVFVIRTNRRIPSLAARVADIFSAISPDLEAPAVTPYGDLLAQDAQYAFVNAELFGILALIATLLALSGIYAVSSYAVEQRTHEFGIRMALGLNAGKAVRVVLGGALLQGCIGIAIGIVVGGSIIKLLTLSLFETSPFDPVTFVSVGALIAACTIFAALVPALRATRVDPAVALRHE